MCPCLYGQCTTQTIGAKTQDICVCESLYTGSQCGYRNGNLYLELPIACCIILAVLMMGIRLTDTARSMLHFPDSKIDYFAFPRSFVPIEREIGLLQPYIGLWKGPTEYSILLKHRWVTRIFVAIVLLMEVIIGVQLASIPFLSVVPWPTESYSVAQLLHYFLLYPFWSHLKANEYSNFLYYSAFAYIFAMIALCAVFGVKHFPLFKPQPKNMSPEGICSLLLRLLTEWSILPIMIVLFLPWQCLFVGYKLEGSLFAMPMYKPECFTWPIVGHISLSMVMVTVYWLLSSAITIQLNSESSFPRPTIWTDARYVQIVHSLKAPLALSVTAFGKSNPLVLCISSTLSSLCLLLLNIWMWPSIYSLVNWIRVYSYLLSSWTGAVGIVVSLLDDPSNQSTYEIWSLGLIALTSIALSGLVVFHIQDFWAHFGSRSKNTPNGTKDTEDIVRENLKLQTIVPTKLTRIRKKTI